VDPTDPTSAGLSERPVAGEDTRPVPPRTLLLSGCAALVLALTGCAPGADAGDPPAASSSAPAGNGVPTPDHVMVVVFENEDAENVVGGPDAPYLTALARAGASFTDAHGETHPSQPNYLALFSGSTHGVVDNTCPLELSGPNLASQLLDAGETFVGYSEGLPGVGFTGCEAGRYARKHNPWVNFPDLPDSVNQPYSALPADFAELPTVSFVVPDLCNDMHDCGVAAGDSWAREHLSGYVAWAEQHNSLLVVTFDEDNGSPANHIATVLVGPMVRPGTSDQAIDHYTLLRTLEAMYGLDPLGRAAEAESLRGIWTD
jgi:phosphatidylinositol-3-phosphatase